MKLQYETETGDPVMGIDEAGRGPLAGAVFAAAVHLPLAAARELAAAAWSGVDDSKKLSAAKRETLAALIKAEPRCVWSIASAAPGEIDRLNILRATHLAMRRAAEGVARQLAERAAANGETAAEPKILVDGLAVPSLPFPSRNLVKGDSKSLLIAAASILAKTARDADCERLEQIYPGYGFAKHKGYPTAEHLRALDKLGPCPEHRRSFGPVAQQNLFPL